MRSPHRDSSHAAAGQVGIALVFAGAMMLTPLAALPAFPDEVTLAPCFIFPSVVTMLVGYLAYFFGSKGAAALTLTRVEAAGVTAAIWVLSVVAYAMPLVLAGMLNVPEAIFESTSGLTTTGFSVVDVASCPKLLLLHRSLMHYVGGVGLILVLACVVNDAHGLKMYNAEGHTERLLSSVSSSARMVLFLYTGIIAAGVVALVVAGMPLFDAINISISAVSTGGFAVRPDSMASYDSFAIELIVVVLMLAGATNFLLNFMLAQGKLRAFARHAETLPFYGIVLVSTLLVAAMLVADHTAGTPFEAVRTALFQVVSVMTSTGLQTVPSFAALCSGVLYVLVFLMVVGGEAGSTAGGIKVYRLVVYVRGLLWSLREKFGHRRRVYSAKINRFGKSIECTKEEVSSVQVYVGVYMTLLALCGFVFALCGAPLGDAIFESASCLGNTGVGVGFIQNGSSPIVLLVGSATMLLGRLEVFPLVFGIRWMLHGIGEEARNVARR
ncbi:MAG TPA: TrkH family potassium uptake protein [Candidatus Aveggerthella excrementigallinarum]|nr:TrkH family potassium uptake protein [Candidatus Aveggerthella excrementigallinarum]